MRPPPILSNFSVATVIVMMAGSVGAAPTHAEMPSADEAREIATDAYVYAYPLVIMELTRRKSTNVPQATTTMAAPVNQFAHLAAFPDAKFTDVVRPNADTLYSSMWFDVTKEPLVISLPASDGRYYLLPILDMWTEVFTSPGSRTTGNSAQTFALAGPDWSGTIPEGIDFVRSPTGMGWIVGRTNTAGPADYEAVHRFQRAIRTAPLSTWGKEAPPPPGSVNPAWKSDKPPIEQVEEMDAPAFFALFSEIVKANPPHDVDYPIFDRMQRIGIVPGEPIDPARLAPEAQHAISDAKAPALQRIAASFHGSGQFVNGWRTNYTAVGTYGADYTHRAGVAYAGLGANTIEDALYPTALVDADGKPFDSRRRYVIHFDKAELPPVRGFWSLTMYNERQLFAENPINRYAIGDRDKLTYNPDGSLDLYVQRDSPGKDKEANWLPAPASGPFTMNLRLYWPKSQALDGTWKAPVVKAVGAM
ncbi:DUF1254 domain-containing protein [Methylobacterium planeticum]|nr:DUF1254 domain-containing protein [Methylobacterium planeticum]